MTNTTQTDKQKLALWDDMCRALHSAAAAYDLIVILGFDDHLPEYKRYADEHRILLAKCKPLETGK